VVLLGELGDPGGPAIRQAETGSRGMVGDLRVMTLAVFERSKFMWLFVRSELDSLRSLRALRSNVVISSGCRFGFTVPG
jgi:hypothetical protein